MDDMKLPENKTCGDCEHFDRCAYLISAAENKKECDWSPIRFINADRRDDD